MENREYEAMFVVEQTHWWFAARRHFLETVWIRYIASARRTPVIADIGAGTGGMVPFLRQFGSVIGIEPNAYGRQLAKSRNILLKKGTAEETGLAKASVDIVCFLDVLYHQGIRDTRAIREAARILRPGGHLVITDCAFPFLSGPHDRAVNGRQRYYLGDLVKKIEVAGFTIQKHTYTFILLFPLFVLKRLFDRLFGITTRNSDVAPAPGWMNTLFSGICRIEAFGLPYIRYPWGSSLLIVAKKSRP